MPELQRVAGHFIHCLCENAAFPFFPGRNPFHGKTETAADILSGAVHCHIPYNPSVAAVFFSHNNRFIRTVHTSSLQIGKKLEGPEGRFGDAAVCHKPEAAVEGCKRNALFLENITEGPVGIGFVHISQPGQLPCDISRVLIGIMQRAIGNIGSIEFRNMDFHPLKFLKAVDNIPGRLKVGISFFRLPQLHITIVAHILRHLCCIVMAGHEIHRYAFFPAEFQEAADPLFILHAADGGAAHTEASIHFLNRRKGQGKQLKVFLHIRILPEAGKIRLVPYLYRPLHHFLFPVAFHQMAQSRLYQCAPGIVVFRRRHIPLPVEYRLFPGSHLVRHEAQLQKRAYIQAQIAVHHQIQIGKIIFRMLYSVFIRVLLINSHIIRKQAVAADVGKSDLLLYQRQLLLILLLQGKPHASCSYAVGHIIMERYFCIFFNSILFFLHHTILLFFNKPVYISPDQIILLTFHNPSAYHSPGRNGTNHAAASCSAGSITREQEPAPSCI